MTPARRNCVFAAWLLIVTGCALAQGQGGPELQPAPAVLEAIGAPYRSDEERVALRLFHGLWTDTDIAQPAARARSALTAGILADPALADPAAEAIDQAEAAFLRGEPRAALALIQGDESARASRIRAEALELSGDIEAAKAAVAPIVRKLKATRISDAAELTEGVRAMGVLARLEGSPGRDYQNMIDLLLKAQQEMDRLYWPAILAQAELLYDKNKNKEAGEAIAEVLALNPTVAAAWRILGMLAVDSFDFGRAELVAAKLDDIAARVTGDPAAKHPYAATILARAWLRQNDPDFAEVKIGEALEQLPQLPEARALAIAAVAMQYDYEEADGLLAEFDALFPKSPLALYETGKALSENRQYGKAAEYLEKASALQPNWAVPLAELGLLEMQSGRDTKALTALKRAVELDPFNDRTKNSLELIEKLATYDTVASDHFIVRYQPGVDGVMARDMLEPLEEIHKIVSGGIDHEPPDKTVIELLPDHEWFAVRITGMTGIHTIAASTGPVIALEAPKIGKKHMQGEYDWVRVLRHEYVHTVTLSRTNNRIPHWFTEAAAVYLEGAPRDYSTCRLLVQALETDTLFDMRQINVAFVRPRGPNDRAQAYAQGHWMYQYIVYRWGERAPLDLMDQYKLGIREDDAMPKVLGVSQEDFLAGFKEWARRDAASWGMLPEPSFRELLLRELEISEEGRSLVFQALSGFALDAGLATSGWARRGEFELELPEPTPEFASRWLNDYPEHPDLLEFLIASDLADSGNKPAPALIPLLERYAAARPVDPMPHRHLAKLYLDAGETAKSIPHLEYLDVREQGSPAFAIELAKRYAELEDWESARRKAARATQIAPFDANQREFAARVAIKTGDLALAERHILALTELEPNQPVHQQRLARIREMRAAGTP